MDDLSADLAELHRVLVKDLIARVRAGEAPAQVLKEARELLKDNGIRDARPQAPIRNLAKVLPFEDPAERPATGTED